MAAEGNKQAGMWDQYQGYLRATQMDDHDQRMHTFYNSVSWKRVAWDTNKSIRSAGDRTTHMLLQSASEQTRDARQQSKYVNTAKLEEFFDKWLGHGQRQGVDWHW
ncbi:predicted protein [Lichtheimia corymbifera JMRC:FSU:9682]|uniref:Uncharacterized protein n=1 Tax=Lichtheimia corymbifera JMRC:FSU:9682 TaxID=1263082 RepID=A0A068SAY2_9FUNG|nr:predicted protein [Lichtheimia corymbifera JMRC:FSU:9682]